METINKDPKRYYRFSDKLSFDGTTCKDGEVLAPKVMHDEDLEKDTTIRANLRTWRRQNRYGQVVNVTVGYFPVKIEEFDLIMWAYYLQEREYVNDAQIISCAEVSLDKLEEDAEDPDKKVVDFPSTTKYEDAYRTDSQMDDYITTVKAENPVDGEILEMKRYTDLKTKEIAARVYPDLKRSQANAKVKEVLDRRDKEYHSIYDN